MIDHREKEVNGLLAEFSQNGYGRIYRVPVFVQMTDQKGQQTLSIGAENVNISIPLEDVADIIKVSKRKGKKKNG